MNTLKKHSRRGFLGLTGKAGLSTLVASAAGINLGVIDLVHAGSKKVTHWRSVGNSSGTIGMAEKRCG